MLPKEIVARLKVGEWGTIYLGDARDGCRITPMDAGFAEQMAAAKDSLREDWDELREWARQ